MGKETESVYQNKQLFVAFLITNEGQRWEKILKSSVEHFQFFWWEFSDLWTHDAAAVPSDWISIKISF